LLWTAGGTITGLAIGGIVLDLGTQANLVTNQTRVYRLIPEAPNRINTVLVVTYFVGGALGTFLAGFAWSLWQWNGVCALGASFFGAAPTTNGMPNGLSRAFGSTLIPATTYVISTKAAVSKNLRIFSRSVSIG
jgi:hypothetical protein